MSKTKTRRQLTEERAKKSRPNIQEQAKQLKIKAEDKSLFVPGGKEAAQKRAQQNVLTGVSFLPIGATVGLAAKAILKGIQAGKTVYKVGNKVFKSKTAAVDAAKKLKAPKKINPKTGLFSSKQRTKDTAVLKTKTTKDINKTAKKKQQLTKEATDAGIKSAAIGTGTAAVNIRPGQLSGKPKPTVKKVTPKKVTPKKPKTDTAQPRTIAQAKKMGKKTFIGKSGKKLAAVTKEELAKSGLSLRDYLNKQRGLTRRKKSGGKVFRRGGGQALRGFGKATYSNKMY